MKNKNNDIYMDHLVTAVQFCCGHVNEALTLGFLNFKCIIQSSNQT